MQELIKRASIPCPVLQTHRNGDHKSCQLGGRLVGAGDGVGVGLQQVGNQRRLTGMGLLDRRPARLVVAADQLRGQRTVSPPAALDLADHAVPCAPLSPRRKR